MRVAANLIGTVLMVAAAARGAGYEISLKVSDRQHEQAVTSKAPELHKPGEARTSMEARPGEKLTAAWKVVRSARDEAKDVLVHFYVVRIGRAGEAPPPLDPVKVPIESALTMDFPSNEASSATLQFKIDQPGMYLVRVEARPNSEEPGHEEYAAVDLVVK
jgi:hypothetical protein